MMCILCVFDETKISRNLMKDFTVKNKWHHQVNNFSKNSQCGFNPLDASFLTAKGQRTLYHPHKHG